MANFAAYHWIVSLSLTTTSQKDNLEEALAHFQRILESNGVVLAWQALEHLSAEGTRLSLHFLWGSCLNRREADRLVRNDLRAFLGLKNPGLSGCQCHVGEGWFDNVGSFKTNRSLITAIKPYLHLLAADTIIDWPLELIRGASDSVAVETKPNMSPERYATLKGGFRRWSLKRLPEAHPQVHPVG